MQTLIKLIFFALLLLVPSKLLAQQICTGALGEPIINIDFGSGTSTYNSVLTDGTGNYTFVSHPPFDGEYTVAKGTFGMFDYVGGWHQIPNHTPNDSDGYMFIASAAPNPGDFYKKTISNLCPNTKYEIAAWIISLPNYPTNNANISICIETTAGIPLIPPVNTGEIINSTSPKWNRYQGVFLTGNETEIVIRMRSNNPGGDGNDFALDDITLRACVPIITPTINNNSTTINTCEGTTDTYVLSADVSDGYPNPKFQWQNYVGGNWVNIIGENATELSVKFANAKKGIYQYRLTAANGDNINSTNCKIFSAPLIINVNENAIADAGADQTILAGQKVTLNGKVSGSGTRYYWSPIDYLDDPTKLNPIANPPIDITYTLHAESTLGCNSTTDDVFIKVYPKIVIPNSFTPNGDAINDTWNIPIAQSFTNTTVRVTNRYGQLVYQSTGEFKPWDGKYKGIDLPSAAYFYTVNFNNGFGNYSGWIMLIR